MIQTPKVKYCYWDRTTEIWELTFENGNMYTIYMSHSPEDFEPSLCIINKGSGTPVLIDSPMYEVIRKIFIKGARNEIL